MPDDDLEAMWIVAGPPPEEQDEPGCLTVLVLLASGLAAGPFFLVAAAWARSALDGRGPAGAGPDDRSGIRVRSIGIWTSPRQLGRARDAPVPAPVRHRGSEDGGPREEGTSEPGGHERPHRLRGMRRCPPVPYRGSKGSRREKVTTGEKVTNVP